MHPISLLSLKTITIKRQTYVGDKSSLSTVATGVKGHLRTLSETQASANGFQFGQAFSLLVDDNIDLQEGDTVVIEGQDYNVNGVANHDRLSIAHRRALLTLPEAT